jgi:hypothetical protein
MKLCFGTLARVLNLHKANKSITQPILIESLLCLPLKNYISHKDEVRIDQQMASRQLSCADSVPPIYIEEAKNAINGFDKGNNVLTVQRVAENFKTRIFDKHLIKIDNHSLSEIVSALFEIIRTDNIGNIKVDEVGGRTKNMLLLQDVFELSGIPSLLAGLFLYTVTAVENKDGSGCVKCIDSNYIAKVKKRIKVVDRYTTGSAEDIVAATSEKLKKICREGNIVRTKNNDLFEILESIKEDDNEYLIVIENKSSDDDIENVLIIRVGELEYEWVADIELCRRLYTIFTRKADRRFTFI